MQEERVEAWRPLRRLVLEIFMSQKSSRPLSIFSGAACWPRLPGQCLGTADPLPSGQTQYLPACFCPAPTHSHVFTVRLGPGPTGYGFQTSSSSLVSKATGQLSRWSPRAFTVSNHREAGVKK